MIQNVSLILGNQLFKPALIPELMKYPVFMCESHDLCTHFKYHQLKIIFFLTAMRDYSDELKSHGVDCFYHKLDTQTQQIYINVLESFCDTHQVECLHVLEIEDRFFEQEIQQFCDRLGLTLKTYKTPMFLTDRQHFDDYLSSTRKPFMKTFYEQQRRRLDVLMDGVKPFGGQWSFDEDNRKKTPKSLTFPSVNLGSQSQHLADVKQLVRSTFSDHIGAEGDCWFPITRTEVDRWVDQFIDERFQLFGDYEDAIDMRSDFLFHSVISPFINCGLITPSEILAKVEGLVSQIPLNSYEGFIRQIIGWREFIRGIYRAYDEVQQEKNFFNHTRRLTSHWYEGTTGIVPLDDAIGQVMRLGYTHHINRLMVIGNIMLTCQIHPQEVYRWFMECFIDSSDWVMGPNVFGMSQFSDGGIFATKPYFSGSNYIRKMSHYSKGEWCAELDALYWRFIIDNQSFFEKNYRMKFMVSKIHSFSADKVDSIMELSEGCMQRLTH